ncbi:MAG: YrzE family protein [Eubacterium sp.]|nr:YrzE family protein [Eubacterium sp.]MBR7060276.1 YrzE family protein [Eubacterium sp.]
MSDRIPDMDYNADEVIENFKAKFKWPKNDDVNVVIKPKKLGLKLLISCIITLVLSGAVYYMMIPALNFKSSELYMFIIAICAIFFFCFSILIGARRKVEAREYAKKKSVIPIAIAGVLILIMLIGYLCGATIFRAKSYSELMPVSNSDFSEDFKDINYDQVPRLDQQTAKVLADQQLGYLDEYKSQYVVTSDLTQINYKGEPVRVAYLQYADFFKWFNNTKNGLPAYMLIDLVSQKVQVVNCVEKFGEGIKYSPTEYFNEKLIRHLRFQYPFAIMDNPNFEIDDNAHPYWITPVLDKTIGLFGGTDVKGVIITDALGGDSEYYSIDTVKTDKKLNWIDVVYNENLIIEQYNYYGKLSNGFWNSIIFQNDVNIASSGSGNIALDDDVWVYTGVTSIKSDSSNFGFILCNQRTKETRYYKNGGAMEYSAVESAKDAVQNYEYNATFPILLDIENQPTYFMSLYGDGYTIKGYALVNLKDKTLVGTGLVDIQKSDAKALNAAVSNYIDALKDKGVVDENASAEDYKVEEEKTDDKKESEKADDSKSELSKVTGEIKDIKTSVNNGNTVYYLKIKDKYYYIAVNDCMEVLLMNKGDKVSVEFKEAEGDFIKAESVER